MLTEQEKRQAHCEAQQRHVVRHPRDRRGSLSVKAYNNGTAKQRLEEKRALVRAVKEDAGCRDCGPSTSWPVCVLEFHHVGQKLANISDLVSQNASWDRLRTEISHCVVLCANHHRMETQRG